MRKARWLLTLCAGCLFVASAGGAVRADEEPDRGGNSAPILRVLRSGLTPEEGRRLADEFGVAFSLDDHGVFEFLDPAFGDVPSSPVPDDATGVGAREPRTDEDGFAAAPMAPDFDALARLQHPPDAQVERMTQAGLDRAGLTIPGPHSVEFLHSELSIDLADGTSMTKLIDTSMRYSFHFEGMPIEGPGARIRLTYAPGGALTQLLWSARLLERGPLAKLISPGQAKHECSMRYPRGAKLAMPRLVYWAPPLSENVSAIYPHYECSGEFDGIQLISGFIQALKFLGPFAQVSASANGDQVSATASVQGGTPPYTFHWASMTTKIPSPSGQSVSYQVIPRSQTAEEVLLLTVKDANGLEDSVTTKLTVTTNVLWAGVLPPTLSVGGEFNVYEWGCVQASSDGFQQTFNANGVFVSFRWNGLNSWERDFKQAGAPTNGIDNLYVDHTDLAWYTGHGGPGSFTFGNTTHDDGSIVPSDARWGDGDLEWLQLESCNVLQSPDGNGKTAVERWGSVFDGLHMLNGFHTTASCVANTAGTFVEKLFPKGNVSAKKIRQAWASMAIQKEPSGKVYVSMGPIRNGDNVWNFEDYFHGQGAVGPDIPAAQSAGLWMLKGTV